ncbi:unnamed protein product [Ilex paraguariensis]|uniref:Pentatricopeptide repeat-containing protein n=1 Tax=Ilex paraguariensis TaxID=185542 RepID=A0ABC8S367_9AQUA
MTISNVPNNTLIRNPLSNNFSTVSSSQFSVKPPFNQSLDSFSMHNKYSPSYRYPVSSAGFFRPHCADLFRWFSVLSLNGCTPKTILETVVSDKNRGSKKKGVACFDKSEFREKAFDGSEWDGNPKRVSEIIEVIRSGGNEMEFKLNLMGLSVSVKSVTEIFRVLSCQRISALHFFRWVRHMNPGLYSNSDACSLIIDNCGWLDDYETMISLLKEFKSKKICLNEKAFGFLPVLGSSKASTMESIRRLVDMLNGIGGSSRGSGICALIKMLCTVDALEMGKFVIQLTDRKVSYYNILIRENCRRGHFKEAHGLIKEMRKLDCGPNAKTYNYLLSYLCMNDRTTEACSVLEEMLESGSPPDALTFEIFIYFACRLGKLDVANQFFDRMVSRGLEPRLTSHAAFVKGCFHARQYEEAYKYVVGASVAYEQSTNMIYSLLAGLHQKHGNLLVAFEILSEMMSKGFKPNFPVYVRTMKRLHKTGKGHLAGDLKRSFSRFRLVSSTTTGLSQS